MNVIITSCGNCRFCYNGQCNYNGMCYGTTKWNTQLNCFVPITYDDCEEE